jgi:hypothetical protein
MRFSHAAPGSTRDAGAFPRQTTLAAHATAMPRLPPAPRLAWVLGGATVAVLLAWVVFASIPPVAVRVGRAATEAIAPLGYQLSAFPVLGAFVGALVLDLLRGDDRRTHAPRVLLVLVTGTLASARLAGALPLSGHALLLFAVLGYELAPPTDRDAPVSLALLMPSLLVVGWCKLVVWGDAFWFAASAALGLALGAVLARIARA